MYLRLASLALLCYFGFESFDSHCIRMIFQPSHKLIFRIQLCLKHTPHLRAVRRKQISAKAAVSPLSWPSDSKWYALLLPRLSLAREPSISLLCRFCFRFCGVFGFAALPAAAAVPPVASNCCRTQNARYSTWECKDFSPLDSPDRTTGNSARFAQYS